ncbi:Hypothetical protein GLP15_3915 [Giardia lamblia P15]|uniref:Uncharacterized protein n=1 Tax=Giardia intestinalis (strain P15) TaxID=658858 RepID=E1F4J9_GIAIA|nr:Hypothetical protein GLP15_3915 [Giardia lamblia P15]
MTTINQLLDRIQSRAVKKTLFSEISKSEHRLTTAASAAYQPSSFMDANGYNFNPFKNTKSSDPLPSNCSLPSFSAMDLEERAVRSKTKRLLSKVEGHLLKARARSLSKPSPEELSNTLMQTVSDVPISSALVSNLCGIDIPVRIAEKRLAVSCDEGIDLKPALYEQVNQIPGKEEQGSTTRLQKYMTYKYDPPTELSSGIDFIDNKVPFLVHERLSTAASGRACDNIGHSGKVDKRSSMLGMDLATAGPEDLRAYFSRSSSPKISIASTNTNVVTPRKSPGDSSSIRSAGSKRTPLRQECSHLRDALLEAPKQFLPEQTLQNYADYKTSVTINQMPHLEQDVLDLETTVERRKFERVLHSPAKLQEKVFQVNPEQVIAADSCRCDCHALPQHQVELLPYLRCPMCLCKIRSVTENTPEPGTTSLYQHLKKVVSMKNKSVPRNLLHNSKTNIDSLVYRTTVLPPEENSASTTAHDSSTKNLLTELREEKEENAQFIGSPLGAINVSPQAISPRLAQRLINRGLNKVTTRNEKLLRAALQQAILADKLWTDRLLMDISPGITPQEIIAILQKRRYDRAPSTVAVPLIRKTATYRNKVVNDDLDHDDLLLSSTLPLIQDYDLQSNSLIDNGLEEPEHGTTRDGFSGMDEHTNKEFEDYAPNPTGAQPLRRVRLSVPESVKIQSPAVLHARHSVADATVFDSLGAQRLKEAKTHDANKAFIPRKQKPDVSNAEKLAEKVLYSRSREQRASRSREIIAEMASAIKETSSKARSRGSLTGSYYLPPSSSVRMRPEELAEFQANVTDGFKVKSNKKEYVFKFSLTCSPIHEYISFHSVKYFKHRSVCGSLNLFVYLSDTTLQAITEAFCLAKKVVDVVVAGTASTHDHCNSPNQPSVYNLAQNRGSNLNVKNGESKSLAEFIEFTAKTRLPKDALLSTSGHLSFSCSYNGFYYVALHLDNKDIMYVDERDYKQLVLAQRKENAPTVVLHNLIESQLKLSENNGTTSTSMRKPQAILSNKLIHNGQEEESTDAIPPVSLNEHEPSPRLMEHDLALSDQDASESQQHADTSNPRAAIASESVCRRALETATDNQKRGLPNDDQSLQHNSVEEMMNETLKSIYADSRLSIDIQKTIVPEASNGYIEKALPVKSVVTAIHRAQSRLRKLTGQAT